VYVWDKQAGAAVGRPPRNRLHDCDVPEPTCVDDGRITPASAGPQPAGAEPRIGAFVAALRLFVVLEAALDGLPAPPPAGAAGTPFFARVSRVLCGFRRDGELREEEALLDELVHALSAHWAHTPETMASGDVLRVTQSARLHCVEQFVHMLIQRHRFSERVAARGCIGEQSDEEREAMLACHACAVQLVHAHMQVATKGLMTYCASTPPPLSSSPSYLTAEKK
jgi:hypothetical protein